MYLEQERATKRLHDEVAQLKAELQAERESHEKTRRDLDGQDGSRCHRGATQLRAATGSEWLPARTGGGIARSPGCRALKASPEVRVLAAVLANR